MKKSWSSQCWLKPWSVRQPAYMFIFTLVWSTRSMLTTRVFSRGCMSEMALTMRVAPRRSNSANLGGDIC